jgi:hypothetical protein
MKITETRSNPGVPYAQDEPGAWGDTYRSEVNAFMTWFNANRSESISTDVVSDTQIVYTIVYASVGDFDDYLTEFNNSGLTPLVEGQDFPEPITMTIDVTVD